MDFEPETDFISDSDRAEVEAERHPPCTHCGEPVCFCPRYCDSGEGTHHHGKPVHLGACHVALINADAIPVAIDDPETTPLPVESMADVVGGRRS